MSDTRNSPTPAAVSSPNEDAQHEYDSSEKLQDLLTAAASSEKSTQRRSVI